MKGKTMEPTKDTVTISKKQYDALIRDSKFLAHLKALGVDNWEGYRGMASDDEQDEIDE